MNEKITFQWQLWQVKIYMPSVFYLFFKISSNYSEMIERSLQCYENLELWEKLAEILQNCVQ